MSGGSEFFWSLQLPLDSTGPRYDMGWQIRIAREVGLVLKASRLLWRQTGVRCWYCSEVLKPTAGFDTGEAFHECKARRSL